MFTNKKDPLVDAVKSVMSEGNLKRQVEEAVNNHFGVSSRKAVPHEHLNEYDTLLEAKLASWRTPRKVREKLENMYGPAQTIHMGDGKVSHMKRHLNDEGEDAYESHTHEYDPETQEVGKLIKHSKPPKSFFKEQTLSPKQKRLAMLDEYILFEERYIKDFRAACIRRALLFFFYFFLNNRIAYPCNDTTSSNCSKI